MGNWDERSPTKWSYMPLLITRDGGPASMQAMFFFWWCYVRRQVYLLRFRRTGPPKTPQPEHRLPRKKVLLMVQKSGEKFTWHVWKPANNGINYQPQLVNTGFLPSTVCWELSQRKKILKIIGSTVGAGFLLAFFLRKTYVGRCPKKRNLCSTTY